MEKLKPKRGLAWLLLAILCAVIALMVFIAKSSHPLLPSFKQEYDKAQGDTLDIGIELNPTIYTVRGDSISGKDYQLLCEISAKHGVPMKFHPFVPLAHAMDYLQRGLYDVVVASMPLTADLKRDFLMTDPVYLDREILIQKVDSLGYPPISSPLQLAKDTVWIPKDSPIRERISNLSREIGDTIFICAHPDYTAEHLFILVAAGRVKQAVINERVARDMHPEYPEVDIATPVSFTQFQSWAVNKNNTALADSLNSWISQLEENAED